MANKQIEECLVDCRIVERNILKGLLDKKKYNSFLKSLPDLAGKVKVCETELPHNSRRTK